MEKKRLPNFGTPSDPVQQLRFYPWGPGRSRLAVKSGMPKIVSQTSMEGGCFENPVPQRRWEVSIQSRKWVKCFWWVDTTLYLCKIFGSIPGWSCLWYLTILLLHLTQNTLWGCEPLGFRVVCEYLGWFVNLQDLDTRPSPNPIGCFSPQEEEVIYLEGRLLIGAMDFPWVGKCRKRLILHPDWRGWKNACVW